MWGDANDRADASKGQMLLAACAQANAVAGDMDRLTLLASADAEDRAAAENVSRADIFEECREHIYPSDWSGFRDYGSDVANLVVAAAYLRNEIKRRIASGESTHRAPRPADKPYNPATGLPNTLN